MSTAAERVRARLDSATEAMAGLRELPGTAMIPVEVNDLRTLLMQAEALHHHSPHAAQAIEVGPS